MMILQVVPNTATMIRSDARTWAPRALGVTLDNADGVSANEGENHTMTASVRHVKINKGWRSISIRSKLDGLTIGAEPARQILEMSFSMRCASRTFSLT